MRVLLITAVLVVATRAQANVGRARFPGTHTAEPIGLGDIAIEREQLSFDLRALATEGGAKVSAIYELANRGASVTAPLVFVTGASVEHEIVVTFDGVTMPGSFSSQDQAALPASWRAPPTTPAIDGGAALVYETKRNLAMAFTLTIPPGRHQLAVSYTAEPQLSKRGAGATVLHQLGYVLAPARDWASFGSLDVAVHVPAGWRVATSPPLTRSGDTLRGQFPALPADTLGITVQAPTGTLHAVLQIALPMLALLVLVGGGFALFALGRARGRNQTKLGPVWPLSLPVALLWALAIGVSGGFAAIRSELAIPAGQSAAHGYGNALGVMLAILVAVIAIPVGHLIVKTGAAGKQRS